MKLDVFHACQQVVRTISPPDALYRDILKNFSQIFQEDDDQGELRIKSTPNNHKIKCTLNTFLERWTNVPFSPLTRSALEEIRNLRCHIIAKGCLSDIPVGYSTKKNEQLHRLFNRSLISGATQISTKLAIALLTILLHYHTKKASSSYHLSNIRIKSNDYKEPLSESKSKNVACTSTVQEKGSDQPHNASGALDKVIVLMADNIEHVCNDQAIAGLILKNAYNLKETIAKTAEHS